MSRRALAFLPPLLALAGCALLTAPKILQTQFFVLNAVAPATGATSNITIGLGPISLPNYLERPDMARRVNENQIAYDPSARWAQPLAENFERVIAANLVQIMNPQRILSFPWYANAAIDYVVTVGASRFEQQPDGNMLLEARWMVRDSHDATIALQTTSYTRPGGTPEQNAAALSALVADLSQAIAAEIPTSPAR